MDIFEAIRGRRSVRKFTGQKVPTEDLLKMLDAARMAPSGGNLQAWRFSVIEKKSQLSEMADLIKKKIGGLQKTVNIDPEVGALLNNLPARFAISSLFFQNAPVAVAVQVGENPYLKPVIQYLMKNGMDLYEAHRALSFTEVQSVAAAIENLMLAAHALGYGTCWMNVPFVALSELERYLGIEDPWHLIALVPVGVPESASITAPGKKDLDEIVVFRE